MGSLLAVLVLAPLVWALLGAPDVPGVTAWLAEHLPELTASGSPDTVPTMLGLAAGMALSLGRPRRATVHVSTVAHEFGHGLTAAALGGRVRRVLLNRDGSGTAHVLPGRGAVRRFVGSAIGYLSPGLLALATVQAVVAGWAVAWVLYLLAALAVMLVLVVRSWWGLLVALVLGGLGWAALQYAPATVIAVAVMVLAGVLAAGGVLDAWEQWRALDTDVDIDVDTDADAMAAMTGLPAGFYAALHILGALALAAAAVAVPLTTA